MPYVCIENNEILSILEYEPSIPASVELIKISQEEYNGILQEDYFFNIKDKKVDIFYNTNKEQEKDNQENLEFLNSTDWKILRHLREQTLGIDTTLSEKEFYNLEHQRQNAAKGIRK